MRIVSTCHGEGMGHVERAPDGEVWIHARRPMKFGIRADLAWADLERISHGQISDSRPDVPDSLPFQCRCGVEYRIYRHYLLEAFESGDRVFPWPKNDAYTTPTRSRPDGLL
jgi:hypothetical protein